MGPWVIVWEELRDGAVIPHYVHEGDAGADLVCVEGASLEPGERRDIPIGLRAALPNRTWAWITARSSTLRRRGLEVHDGIIDGGYRGEWFVGVTNMNDHPVSVEVGDRLAQVILMDLLPHPEMLRGVVSLDTDRGDGGFGSTGLKHG